MSEIRVHPMGGALGAEVRGAQLRSLSSMAAIALREALLDHGVLFFRDAGLGDDEHLRVAEAFGQPSIFPLSRMMGATEPTFQVIRDDADSPPSADNWHTDVTWIAEPPSMAFLRATLVPPTGGDTMWGSMTAAYEALSAPMKKLCDGLRVVHDNASFIRGMERKLGREGVAEIAGRLRKEYPPVEHPLVRLHPETGRRALLFGGNFMRRIVGLTSLESDRLLAFLHSHIAEPRFHVRWRWNEGDFVIWDERCTVHRALGDHFPQAREVRRCTVDGHSAPAS